MAAIHYKNGAPGDSPGTAKQESVLDRHVFDDAPLGLVLQPCRLLLVDGNRGRDEEVVIVRVAPERITNDSRFIRDRSIESAARRSTFPDPREEGGASHRLGMRQEEIRLRAKLFNLPGIVMVQERDVSPFRFLDTPVPRGPDTKIGLLDEAKAGGPSFEPRGCIVRAR